MHHRRYLPWRRQKGSADTDVERAEGRFLAALVLVIRMHIAGPMTEHVIFDGETFKLVV